MKVKDLILMLRAFDQDSEIVIGYDFPYDFQEPHFERVMDDVTSYSGELLLKGSYIHKAE